LSRLGGIRAPDARPNEAGPFGAVRGVRKIMMRKILLIIWIIITLLLATLLVSEKIENKRLSDNLGIEQDWQRDYRPTDIDKLPPEPGVYVLWKEERVIHVGQSGNLKQRLSQHEKKKQMTSFDWYQSKTEEKPDD
jgi:hypothetical protein